MEEAGGYPRVVELGLPRGTRLRIRGAGAGPVIIEIVLCHVERTVETFDVVGHLHVDLMPERSLEETRNIKILPVPRQIDTCGEFRYRGAHVHAVVLVDDQVAVLVDELHVTGLNIVRIDRLRRRGQDLHPVLENTVHHEHVERSDRITGLGQGHVDTVVHTTARHAAVDGKHLVFQPAAVEAHLEAAVGIVPAIEHLQVDTRVEHATVVHPCRLRISRGGRHGLQHEHVVALLIKIVDRETERPAEQLHVESHVELAARFPLEILVAYLRLHISRSHQPAERGIVVGHVAVFGRIGRHVLVAGRTPARTQLEYVDELRILHEVLLLDVPASRHGVERSPAVPALEARRTVLPHRSGRIIFLLVVVAHRTEERRERESLLVLVRGAALDIEPLADEHQVVGEVLVGILHGVGRGTHRLETGHGRQVVVAEALVPVEHRIEGPVEIVVVLHQQTVGIVDPAARSPGLVELTVAARHVIHAGHGTRSDVERKFDEHVGRRDDRLLVTNPVRFVDHTHRVVSVPEERIIDPLTEIGARQVHIVALGIVGGNGRRTEQGVADGAAALVVLIAVAGAGNALRFGHATEDVHPHVEPRLDVGLDVGTERHLLVSAVLDDTVLIEERTRHRIGGALATARDGEFVALQRSGTEKLPDMVHVGQSVEVASLDQVALHAAHGIVVAGRLVINGDIIGRVDHRSEIAVGLHARFRIERNARRTGTSLFGGDHDDTVAAPRTVDRSRGGILQHGDIFDVVGRHGIQSSLDLDAVDDVERFVAGVYRPHAAHAHRHVGSRSSAGRRNLHPRHAPLKGELGRRYGNLGEFGTLHLIHRTQHVAFALYRIAHHHELLDLVGGHIQRHIDDGTSAHGHRTRLVAEVGEFERSVRGDVPQLVRAVHVGRYTARSTGNDDAHPYERYAGLRIGHHAPYPTGLLGRQLRQRHSKDKKQKKQ